MQKEAYFKNVCKDMQSVKDVDVKSKTVTGYLSVFNVEDSDRDIILPGSFARSIRENGPSGKDRIKFLREHNRNWNVGKIVDLKEDQTGLYFEAKLNETQVGKDLAILYESGEINEHSVMFTMVPGGWTLREQGDYGKGIFFSEVKLWEGSAVTWGANEFAVLTGLKSKFEAIERLSGLSDETLAIVSEIVTKLAANNQSPGGSHTQQDAETKQLQRAKELVSHFKSHLYGR
jgi:uncharacterized protein